MLMITFEREAKLCHEIFILPSPEKLANFMLESVLSREADKELFKDIKSVYANENKRPLLLQMRTNLSLDAGQLADSWLI